MERATFSGTTGDLSRYSSFSVSSRWNRISLSICAILFNSAGGWRLEFIPPFSMFPGKRCLRAVALFLFISYRNVENGNCICRGKIVLDSFDFVKIRSQSNFHFWTKFNSILRRNCRKVPAVLQHTFSVMSAIFRICGNDSQPDLQIVEKLATPLRMIRIITILELAQVLSL